MPLVDWEQITRGLIPTQVSGTCGWCSRVVAGPDAGGGGMETASEAC